MDKYRNKYRIKSARAPWWDYGQNGAYFVTICTRRRYHYFGQVLKQEMRLSNIGQIADACWMAIPDHFPFVRLGKHVIMPNHVHGIVIIDKQAGNDRPGDGDAIGDGGVGNDDGTVETQNFASLPHPSEPQSSELESKSSLPKNRFGPQSKNLASIIRGFKIGVTKNARQIDPDFAWQARYHDHIIRNARAFQNISAYISNNPANWKTDRFH